MRKRPNIDRNVVSFARLSDTQTPLCNATEASCLEFWSKIRAVQNCNARGIERGTCDAQLVTDPCSSSFFLKKQRHWINVAAVETGLDSNMLEKIIFRSLSLKQGPTEYEGENYRSQQD